VTEQQAPPSSGVAGQYRSLSPTLNKSVTNKETAAEGATLSHQSLPAWNWNRLAAPSLKYSEYQSDYFEIIAVCETIKTIETEMSPTLDF
jgi:hypothetical protein